MAETTNAKAPSLSKTWAFVICLAAGTAAHATTVTFDEFAPPILIGSGTAPNVGLGGTVESQGFLFTLGEDAVGIIGLGTQCDPQCPYNGTPYALIDDSGLHVGITIRRADSALFSFNSFDAAESHVGLLFEADKLRVTGSLLDGGTITYVFDLDGLNDGDGSIPDFQRFFLPQQFVDLTALTITGFGGFYDGGPDQFWRDDFSVDNFVFDESFGSANGCYPFPGGGQVSGCFPGPGPFPAPEPGTLTLLGIGLAGLGFCRRRRPMGGRVS